MRPLIFVSGLAHLVSAALRHGLSCVIEGSRISIYIAFTIVT